MSPAGCSALPSADEPICRMRDVSGTQAGYGYINGTTKRTGNVQKGVIHASAEPLWLGNFNGGSAGFEGQIDELRISRVARSQVWLKASHDTVAGIPMGSDPIAEGSDLWAQSFDAVAWMPREGLTPVGANLQSGQNGIDREINIV